MNIHCEKQTLTFKDYSLLLYNYVPHYYYYHITIIVLEEQ